MAKNNTRNENSFLFKVLTRIFSGPIVQYRQQNQNKFRRHQLDKFKFKSASGMAFKKSMFNPFENLYKYQRASVMRHERYLEFDQMESMSPELNSALDIYADEMTTSSQYSKILNIICANQEIKDILENLFYKVLNIEFNLFGWSRCMCKYGDHFLYLDVDEQIGVKGTTALPAQEVERLEGEDASNPNYIQFQWNTGGLTFENWQIAHFRILGNDKYAPYGTSVLDPCRRPFRQLDLQEQLVMAYRATRSAERRAFYIDVAGIDPDDVEQFIQKIITETKRTQLADPESGLAELRFNPMSVEEDLYIPVRGNESGTKIEPLPGGAYTGDIDDVVYFQNKVIAGVKIPRSYLIEQTTGEGGGEDKTTLAQKDIRFAKTVQRLQKSVVAELEKIAVLHLFILGYRGKDLLSFKLSLNNPSKISELQELEHWRTKFDVAAAANEGFFSKRYIATKILGLTEEDFKRNINEMFFDKYIENQLETISDPAGGDDLGGGGGSDLGSTGEESKDDEDEVLLASPQQKRAPHLTPGAKGKVYTPVATDKRSMGARQRAYNALYSKELASNTTRNTFKGASDLGQLAKGIYEAQETIYSTEKDIEENILLENTDEIKKLINKLEVVPKFAKKK